MSVEKDISEIHRYLRTVVPVFLNDPNTAEVNIDSVSRSIYSLFVLPKDQTIKELREKVGGLEHQLKVYKAECEELIYKEAAKDDLLKEAVEVMQTVKDSLLHRYIGEEWKDKFDSLLAKIREANVSKD